MSEIESKAGLILAGLVIFIFLMVVAFIKRNSLAKADDPNRQEVKKGAVDQGSDYKK